jgi:hypothetical protein
LGSFKYIKKRKLGKVNSPLNKILENVEWGEEIYLKDLFTIKRGKRLTVENRIKGNRPLVTAGYENTGIAELIGNNEQEIFKKNTITIDMFANTFFRNYAYSADDNILVLDNKEQLSPKAKIFIVSLINKALKENFSYGRQYRMGSFNETKIKLPILNGEINFTFIEKFIAELEAEHIAKIEAYLLASCLKDYTLTNEDQKVLYNFENGNIKFNEFKIEELFDINSYKKRFDANKVTILESGKPYIVRTSLNNGTRGYINEDEQFLNEGNTISFGQDTATIFYQEKPYFTGDKIKILKSKDNRFNKQNAQFFISTMLKSFSSFSWGASSYSVKIIENQPIKLPTKNKQPDYKTMEILLSAIQKLVIKDVVLYANKKIDTTKKVVNGKL